MVKNKLNSDRNDSSVSYEAKRILSFIQNLNLTPEQLEKTFKEVLSQVQKKESVSVSIFTKKLTILEAIVKFLREEKKYSYHSIGQLLGRNEKNIWHTYHSAIKKVPSVSHAISSEISVPLEIFQDENSAPLEALVVYLKEELELSFSEISRILSRKDSTLRTSFVRAKQKHGKKE